MWNCARQMYVPDSFFATLRKKSFFSPILGLLKGRPCLTQVAVDEKKAVTDVQKQENSSFSFNVTVSLHVVCAYGTSEIDKKRPLLRFIYINIACI